MIIIIIMISNNVPTTAPLITATLIESSSLSLDGTLDTTVTAQATHSYIMLCYYQNVIQQH